MTSYARMQRNAERARESQYQDSQCDRWLNEHKPDATLEQRQAFRRHYDDNPNSLTGNSRYTHAWMLTNMP